MIVNYINICIPTQLPIELDPRYVDCHFMTTLHEKTCDGGKITGERYPGHHLLQLRYLTSQSFQK